MCGIFGLVASNLHTVSRSDVKDSLASLFSLSMSRGTEAAGLAAMTSEAIRVIKRPVSAKQLISSHEYRSLLDAVYKEAKEHEAPLTCIGHSRLVTNGSAESHNNNQPVLKDGIVGIHNGIIVNVDTLWQEHEDLHRAYEVDTEVLFALIGKGITNGLSLAEATVEAFTCIKGVASIATLFREYGTLLLASNNGSLFFAFNEQTHDFAFASELQILRDFCKKSGAFASQFSPEHIQQVQPNTGLLLHLNAGSLDHFSFSDANAARPAELGFQRSVIDELAPTGAAASNNAIQYAHSEASRRIAAAEKKYPYDTQFTDSLRRCCKCILPETMPFIEFDAQGVCNYCRYYQPIKYYGKDALRSLADSIRSSDNSPDTLVGISGGRDSCYGLHYLKEELGLNPVAFTYDWGMVTDLARRNISRLCGTLGVEHILVSADIKKKRSFIRKNVTAWLKKPVLGLIPLFMAGDKAYFYHANRLKKEMNIAKIMLCENMLERTDFKIGFAGIRPAHIDPDRHFTLPLGSMLKLLGFYGGNYLKNPAYFNNSLLDTFGAYLSYYVIEKDYANLFKYIPWIEDEVIGTLRNTYDWELSPDTKSTWRIGDGTASFYNLIYYRVMGFTEIDTFRSNQIREGLLNREDALRISYEENKPRIESVYWYCVTNGIDFEGALEKISHIPRLQAKHRESLAA